MRRESPPNNKSALTSHFDNFLLAPFGWSPSVNVKEGYEGYDAGRAVQQSKNEEKLVGVRRRTSCSNGGPSCRIEKSDKAAQQVEPSVPNQDPTEKITSPAPFEKGTIDKLVSLFVIFHTTTKARAPSTRADGCVSHTVTPSCVEKPRPCKGTKYPDRRGHQQGRGKARAGGRCRFILAGVPSKTLIALSSAHLKQGRCGAFYLQYSHSQAAHVLSCTICAGFSVDRIPFLNLASSIMERKDRSKT